MMRVGDRISCKIRTLVVVQILQSRSRLPHPCLMDSQCLDRSGRWHVRRFSTRKYERATESVSAGHPIFYDMHSYGNMMHMRTTLILDDTLIAEARRLTGLTEKTAIVHAGLQALISRESARRLASLGGSDTHGAAPPRRRTAVRRARRWCSSTRRSGLTTCGGAASGWRQCSKRAAWRAIRSSSESSRAGTAGAPGGAAWPVAAPPGIAGRLT